MQTVWRREENNGTRGRRRPVVVSILKEPVNMQTLCSRFLVAALLVSGVSVACSYAQSAPSADNPSASHQLRISALALTQVQGRRAIAMAKGIPADSFTYTPGNGGRTIANLFLHLAFSLWTRPAQLGAAPPVGFDMTQKADSYENSTTDKTKVLEQLSQAVEYAENALRNLPDANLQNHIKANGRENLVAIVLAAWVADNSEHIGQLMVYSRLHGFAPPTPGQVATPQDGQ
jgi:hypothetical protein